jgi:hypothetical protein
MTDFVLFELPCISAGERNRQEFYILLTVHLDVILVNDQLYTLFSMYLFHASTRFEQQVLIIRGIKLCQYIVWYNTLWWVTVLCAGRKPGFSPRPITIGFVMDEVALDRCFCENFCYTPYSLIQLSLAL